MTWWAQTRELGQTSLGGDEHLTSTVQSRFSDIKFSDNLWFSDYFSKNIFNLLHKIIRFSDIMQFSDNFWGDQKCH